MSDKKPTFGELRGASPPEPPPAQDPFEALIQSWMPDGPANSEYGRGYDAARSKCARQLRDLLASLPRLSSTLEEIRQVRNRMNADLKRLGEYDRSDVVSLVELTEALDESHR
jgi:hypothetical protein